MKKLVALLLFLICSTLNAQWVWQNSGTENAIRDVQFINSQTGWACGDNIIYKTTNAGTNWAINFSDTDGLIQQIYPVDSMVVYAVGWFQKILKTSNGGENWITIRNGQPSSGTFEGVYFVDQNTGWLCGSLKILKTTNGGETFDSTYIPSDLNDIHFRNANDGIVSGNVLAFYRTTNGGSNWSKIVMPANQGHNFNRISVVRDTIVYLVGHGKKVFRSSNYGLNWDTVGAISQADEIYCSNFPSNDTGYAGGTFGEFFKTTNGGRTWRLENTTSFTGFIRSVFFYNNTTGWLVGGGGRIQYTTSGGQTDVKLISSIIPSDFILNQNYPNPFNPVTNITYEIKKSSKVEIKVYNSLGKEMQILVSEFQNPGKYQITFNAENFNSGMYFYTLISDGKNIATKKMILLK